MIHLLTMLLLDVDPAVPPTRSAIAAASRPPVLSRRPRDDDDDEDGAKAATPAPKGGHDREDDDDDDERRVQPSSAIVVTAKALDLARTQIDAGLGATVYALTNDAIEDRPGGETGSIADILAQAPGVSLSGAGLTIRGAPADQVRINGVIVPEAVADPADRLSARLAETTRLLTGTLPAQFGFAPGGVISITTKNGLYEHGGQAELFAGSNGMIEPALEWAGSVGGTSLFASGSFERNRSSVATADGAFGEDRSREGSGLGFADHVIDDDDRVSLLIGGGHRRDDFEGTEAGPGTELNDDGFVVGTFQHSVAAFTLQASLFAGLASRQDRFAALSSDDRRSFGTQIDVSETLNAGHLLRFGLLAARSSVSEVPATAPWTDRRTSLAVYLQDEWSIVHGLTVNPGARVEWLRGFASGATVEPRASLVWQPDASLTTHLGYARYASAAALDEQPGGASLPVEQDDYVDAGVERHAGPLTLALDGYWRAAHHYLVERATPGAAGPAVLAFNQARFKGLELSVTYSEGHALAWANLALTSATARGMIDGERLFPPPTVQAASVAPVPLAGDRPVLASGGLTRRLGKLSLSGDVTFASGAARTLDPEHPNGSRYGPAALVGAAAVYHLNLANHGLDLRVDLTNLTNVHAVTNDARALEGGWTRQQAGRAIAVGVEQGF